MCKKESPLKTPVWIATFGEFSVTVGSVRINGEDTRMYQVWHLLILLIVNRKNPLSQEELIDRLWDDKDLQNPAHALKNLVYRARNLIGSYDIAGAKDFILAREGGYCWNPEIYCVVDFENFAEYFANAQQPDATNATKKREYQEMIRLYRGHFLASFAGEEWLNPHRDAYCQMFSMAATELTDLLIAEGAYASAESLSSYMLSRFSPFCEGMNQKIVHCLLAQKQVRQAAAHYLFVEDMHGKANGYVEAETIEAMQQELLQHFSWRDIQSLRRENPVNETAFYCSQDVFKDLYLIEVRSALFTGQQLCMIYIRVQSKNTDYPGARREREDAMAILNEVLQKMLQVGNFYTNLSENNYAVFPFLTSQVAGEELAERIVKRFQYVHRNPNLELSSQVQLLEPK